MQQKNDNVRFEVVFLNFYRAVVNILVFCKSVIHGFCVILINMISVNIHRMKSNLYTLMTSNADHIGRVV
jgi:hypothetical protein